MSGKTEEAKQAIIANLQAKTGKDMMGWLKELSDKKPADKKEARAWLQGQGLGHFQAMIVTKEYFGE